MSQELSPRLICQTHHGGAAAAALLSPAAGAIGATTACGWSGPVAAVTALGGFQARRTSPPPQWPGRSGCARWSQQGLVTDRSWAQELVAPVACQQTAAPRVRLAHRPPRRLTQSWHGGTTWLGHRHGALRKHPSTSLRCRSFLHGAHHAHGVAARGAFDVQRCRQRWPACQSRANPAVRFGDEAAMPRRVHHRNIEPRNVVGHQHDRTAHRRRALHP